MAKGGSSNNKKIANHLVALSSAAVMAVYAAGYTRTQAAADKLVSQESQRRRPPVPLPPAPSAIETARPPAPQPPAESLEAKAVAPERPAVTAPVEKPAPVATPAPVPAAAPEPVPAAPTVVAKADTPVLAPPPPPPPTPAPAPAPAPASASSAAPKWKDGTYYGWGSCRHGDIQAEVVIESGRIAVASIHKCRTRYSCSVIDRLPPEVVQRQSPEIDYVSGATESADAFYNALIDALNQAK
jgi:uncharacterized protein with FMN-binding domain